MKQLFTSIILCYTLLSACNGPSKKETISGEELQKTVLKTFSDSLKADTFTLQIQGDKPRDMRLLFTIRSWQGQEIYRTTISATSLFKNYNATIDLSKKNNQIKFLKEEMDEFFEEENFMEPAVTEGEHPDQYVPDKPFFEELKQNQLNGFMYRLGKDDKRYIAWSASERKVKTYYSCCQ